MGAVCRLRCRDDAGDGTLAAVLRDDPAGGAGAASAALGGAAHGDWLAPLGVEPRAYLREATLRAVRNPGTVTLARDLK